MGEGANQHNDRYGFSSTLTYSGDLLIDGETVGSGIQCCGDVHGEMECCLPFSITRTYTASDCAGNSTSFSYQIVSSGEPCPESEGATADGTEPLPEGRMGMVMVTGLSPNPAAGEVSLRYTVEEDTEVEVTLLNLSGQVVASLGTTAVGSGEEHQLDFQVGHLPAGLYQLQVSSSREQAVRSLLVVH